MSNATKLFRLSVQAIRNDELIEREGRSDKEFHFQNWFQKRLHTLGLKFDQPARNTYPDFRLVHSPEGYELKGLAYPGREANYDSNSQVPCGEHNGRQVYYLRAISEGTGRQHLSRRGPCAMPRQLPQRR